MSGLETLSTYNSLYLNVDVAIPLYEDMTEDQLKIRLPISLGLARQIIDNSADSLFGENKLLGIQMLGLGGQPDETLQAFWDKFFLSNHVRSKLISNALTSFVEGGLFYIIEHHPTAGDLAPVFLLHPLTYTYLWDIQTADDTTQTPLLYVFQWEEIIQENNQDRYCWRRLEIDNMQFRRYKEASTRATSNDGDRTEMDLLSAVDHSCGVIPVVHVRHNQQTDSLLGISEIEPLLPMLNAINQMISDAYWQAYNDQSIIKVYNVKPPDDDDDPSTNSKVRLGGDQIHFMSETEQSKQDIQRLEPAGIPQSFFKTLEMLIDHVYRAANELSLDPTQWTSTNISGKALKLLYTPVTRKAHRNRIAWNLAFEDLAKLLFRIANSHGVVLSPQPDNKYILGGPEYTLGSVNVQWGEVIASDEKDDQEIILADLEAGLITIETAQRLRGLDPETNIGSDKTP